ncbi:hypothetical protein NET02_11805 [Thermomicrobiaceae bacterium CFH 74404]|uniref:Uncharacterized protein n=1 Tax=Thermalbibacter longus TaxID=2951981 RepID=A0AA41WGS9_9BACT|nr:hypothetical protein [Thermalbibacter longus]MCM8749833.1 hypothetical protein [Thermalbibacter longus]
MAVPAHLRSAKVPGGSLLAALLDRRLQAWSDRGGASQQIGERWSRLVAEELAGWVGRQLPLDGAGSARLSGVIWLDAEPAIERHAGRNGLANPDFLLIYDTIDGALALQPADAKFAVQVVKPEQIRASALRALLDSGNPALEHALSQRLPDIDIRQARVVDGFVVSPAGILTEHYRHRLVNDPSVGLRPEQIVTLAVDPRRMFAGLPVARLVGVLAGIDRLPVRPAHELVAAVYYVRLACACAWFWQEERRPLLSLDGPPPLDLDALRDEVVSRAAAAESAFSLVERWAADTEAIRRDREALEPFLSPPLRNRELLELVENAGLAQDRASLRSLRRELTSWYRSELIARLGCIPARAGRPIAEILQELAMISRELAPLASAWVRERIASVALERGG